MVCLTGENNHFMFIVINIFKSHGFFVNLCKHVVSVSMYAVSEQRCEKQGDKSKSHCKQ